MSAEWQAGDLIEQSKGTRNWRVWCVVEVSPRNDGEWVATCEMLEVADAGWRPKVAISELKRMQWTKVA